MRGPGRLTTGACTRSLLMTLIRPDEFGQPMRLLPAKKSYRFGPIFLLLILALEFPSVFASQAAKKVGGNPPSQADQRSLSIREDFHLKLRLSSDVNAPASTKVAAKLLGNDFELALFQHQVEIQGNRFDVRYKLELPSAAAKLSGIPYIARHGQGLITAQGLQGQKMTEQRGPKGDSYEVRLEADSKTVSLLKNQKKFKEDVVGGLYTDLTSLPYFWFGKPVKVGRVRLDVMDTKKIYQETFVGRLTNARFQGQVIKAVQFDKVKRNAEDAELSIMVRESDGFPLRVDLGLSAKYGVTALMFPKTIPPATPNFNNR
ncbi:MAG: hypothetical protein EB072_00420 [Betaproteobacteria bacterium]|nr:hypothetical protein [Betaproteobacteria bacterium]